MWLCFVEHWRNYEELSIINIPGYYLASYFCRPDSKLHGGSVIYVKNNILVKHLFDVSDLAIQNLFEVSSTFILKFSVLCIAIYIVPKINKVQYDMVLNRLYDLLNRIHMYNTGS